jgi:hypothetical protein
MMLQSAHFCSLALDIACWHYVYSKPQQMFVLLNGHVCCGCNVCLPLAPAPTNSMLQRHP